MVSIGIAIISLIIYGLLCIIFSEILNSTIKLTYGKSLLFCDTLFLVVGLTVLRISQPIEQMYSIVLYTILLLIIPLTSSHLIVWIFSKKPSIVRILYCSHISWITCLLFILVLEILLGFSTTSIIAVALIDFILCIGTSIISGFIGLYIVKKAENFSPSTHSIQ